ncbi:MAG: polynucleotide kinase-phosphatase [Planctomycetota bacterium]|nr:polynucleotide kinase-phosphatase [Planctomycetota bacterium]
MKGITVPELSLVVLIGPSGSGKSSFARRHFKPTEVLSSDFCRGLVSDDENNQAATNDAFDVLHFIARKRLAAGKLTVVDATNIRPEDRRPLVALAREFHCLPVAFVLDIPKGVCIERNRDRPNRNFGPRVVVQQISQMRRGLRGLKREGFRHIHKLSSVEEVEAISAIERTPLYSDLRNQHGPFDIIGDLHGCCDELETLLGDLGYEVTERREGQALDSGPVYEHLEGREAVFLGDLGDRGPRVLDCFRLVHNMVKAGHALCVPGNHDMKLNRLLRGKNVQIKHGLARTVEELDALPEDIAPAFRDQLAEFIYSLVSHYVLDDGKIVVAHAGMKEEMQGRGSGKVREFALYGETTGETDEFGLPIRYDWASEYRGCASVVYGHTPVPEPEWLNRTINIDTGCVFGGKLTALRYPERELVSVPSARAYFESAKPFLVGDANDSALTAQQEQDDLLDISDVTGKRIISTRLRSSVTIREENSIAALEVMSRFAVNPKWLIYLPPTMSPSETSKEPGLLEHPAEAFSYYRRQRIDKVICEEKHMGSRAVVIVCRDEGVSRARFGVIDEGIGTCYTRTGRRFFNDDAVEAEFLQRINAAIERAGLWQEFNTDWLCLDCELMPWSAKAQELLRSQYAAVGAAARAAVPDVVDALATTAERGCDMNGLLERYRAKGDCSSKFVDAYRQYCWPVSSVSDLKLAPFHILASEAAVHTDQDHAWHMETLTRLCATDEELLLATPNRLVDLGDPSSEEEGCRWWSELTGRGGEGMVVKPLAFIDKGKKGLVQPALKCRGREYLRIIYGAEYTADEHLDRLRNRSLSAKRSLALREFALGMESLERFVQREPLRRVHECVFGVLALESEPVDPRL